MLRAAVVTIAAALAAAAGGVAGESPGIAPHRMSLPSNRSEVTLGPLDEPSAVDVGPDGAVYVLETGASRVSVFDLEGRLLRRWGRPGVRPGDMRRPRGIAVAPDGRVYVSDTGNHRVESFSPEGVFERAWGSYGSGNGQFLEPLGLAADAGKIYVADARNNRVQVFDRQGTFERYVWSYGTREGQFDRPVDVAASRDGSFFVSDQGNSRIQKFDAQAGFLLAWGGWGPQPGLFAEPGGVVVHEGRLLIADTHNHRIQQFGTKGEIEGAWGEDVLGGVGRVGGQAFPVDVASLALRGGRGLVFCDAGADLCRIVADGPSASRASSASPMTSTSRAAAIDGHTLIVAAGGGGFLALDVSGARPRALGAFGGSGREALQFVRPAGLAIDARRDKVLVSDPGNERLAWLDLRSSSKDSVPLDPARVRFERSIYLGDEESLVFGAIPWTLSPPLLEPGAVARGGRGGTFVLDTLFDRIVVFDEEFRPVSAWGSQGEGDGSFLEPVDLALDASGETLYVLDAGTGRVQVFDRAGRRLFGWGRLGAGKGQLRRPTSIAAAPDGTVVLSDRVGRILRFSRRGAFLRAWGRAGTEPGRLDHPDRVLVDPSGRVIVLDGAGRRLQAFSREGRFLWDYDVIAQVTAIRHTLSTTAAKAASRSAPRPSSAGPDGEQGCPRRTPSNGGRYVVCWSASVDPLPHNEPFTLDVSVYDAAKPDAPATMVALGVDASMPEHGHGLVQPPVVQAIGPAIPRERLPDHALVHGVAVGNGRFEVKDVRLHMPGRWEIYFDIGRGAVIERAQVEIRLD